MSIINQYIFSIKFVDRVVKMRTEGLSHADSMLQLDVPYNCMNWNIGHLLVYRDEILQRIDPARPGADKDEFAMYGAGSDPLTDGEKAIPLETLLARMEVASAELISLLENMPTERLDEPFGDPDSIFGGTLGGNLGFYILFHEPVHVGQLEVARELANAANK